MTTYDDIKEQYDIHANNLVEIAKKTTNESIEGNMYTHHMNFELYLPGLKRRQNLYIASLGHKYLLEIGFNAGHSSLVMVLSNPDSVIYAFDICEHSYVKPCLEYLRSKFGKSRIVLYEGNSLDMVPNTFMENKPTLFHIDGCHLYDVAVKDMENCYNLAENNDVIILDDTNIYYLDKLWYSYIYQNKIVQFQDPRLVNFVDMECRHQIGLVKKN